MKINKVKILPILMMLLSLVILTSGCMKEDSEVNMTASETSQTAESSENTGQNSQLKTFTLDELAKYNGKNGNPAYVAVDGNVYDVSNVAEWKEGIHNNRFEAGRDLTREIKLSPHGKTKLDLVPMVGILEN